MNTSHLILSVFSLVFFCIGVSIPSSQGRIGKGFFVVLAACFLLYTVYTVFYAVCYFFTRKGIDHAVLYHVKYGLDGAGYGEYSSLIILTSVFLIFSFVAGLYFLFRHSKGKGNLARRFILLSLFFLLLSGIVHPATVDLYSLTQTHEGEPFWKYYKTPYIHSSGSASKNFIFIYAESLERTYFDEQVFPGLIKDLREIETESITFTDIGQYPETGWTIAGMVASQCGLPLLAPSHGNSMGGMDSFLAGADCMGDLLSQEGYDLVFMGGASLEFAGKGKFFQTHGFGEVLGRPELVPLLSDKSYQSSWGLYDDSLFDIALKKFEKLSGTGQPFGLFLLTLDTHGSDNNFSRSCEGIVYADGKNGMLNAVACSDYLISSFIRRVQQSSWYKDTVIILASDHWAMGNSAYGMLTKSHKRQNLFFVLDPDRDAGVVVDKQGSTLDIGITVLSVLGFRSYLGLGRNLLQDEPSIWGQENLDRALGGWRKNILKFWSFPEVTEDIQIDAEGKNIKIDDRTFNMPALIQYDDKLQTQMWFERYNSPNHKTLLEHLMKFEPEAPFLLVNACNRIPEDWTGIQREGLCLISGKLSSAELRVEHISDTVLLSVEQLREVAAEVSISERIYKTRMQQIIIAQKNNKLKK